MRLTLGLIAALTIIVAISCSHLDPVSTNDLGESRFVDLEEGGAFEDQIRYILTDSDVVRETYRYKEGAYPLREQERVPLSESEAKILWSTILKAEIPKWRTRYEPSQIGVEIMGGTQWSLTMRVGKRTFKSNGDNTYPAFSPVGDPTFDDNNAYKRVLGVLESVFHNYDEDSTDLKNLELNQCR